jgi:ribosomal RNA assembly protein
MISKDRIGVLIGENGRVKDQIERDLNVILNVDGEAGVVVIRARDPNVNPLAVLKAKDAVTAIARGFSPEKAFELFDEDIILHVLDLRELFGKSESDIQRIKGRIIGRDGKSRRSIEEITQADISINEHAIGIIGSYDSVSLAREGVEMLIKGKQHATVYQHLKNKSREIKKKKKIDLWEKPHKEIR